MRSFFLALTTDEPVTVLPETFAAIVFSFFALVEYVLCDFETTQRHADFLQAFVLARALTVYCFPDFFSVIRLEFLLPTLNNAGFVGPAACVTAVPLN